MCCSTFNSRSEKGGAEACRRQNCGGRFSQSATRFTPTDWPELKILRPKTNQDQGKSSHPLEYSPRGEGRGGTPAALTTNEGPRVVLPAGVKYSVARIPSPSHPPARYGSARGERVFNVRSNCDNARWSLTPRKFALTSPHTHAGAARAALPD